LGNFGIPTGELGTVEQTNEEDAVVKWDDDGRKRLDQPCLKKMPVSEHRPVQKNVQFLHKKMFTIWLLGVLFPDRIACGGSGMPSDEWIRALADGRRVKFTNQELADWVFITAQIEGNKVVYSVVLTNAESPLSRGDVESHFEGELQKVATRPEAKPL
jgi:hypothetical protein